MRRNGRKLANRLLWLSLAGVVAVAPTAAIADPAGITEGLKDDSCAGPGSAGGEGQFEITGPETLSFWGGDWDLVKRMDPPAGTSRLSRVCLCLNSNDHVNSDYSFDLAVYRADGPGGQPGTRVLSVPARVSIQSLSFDLSGWHGPYFYGFDLSQYGVDASGPLYVGVHSHTEGTDLHSLNICQYPHPASGPISYYHNTYYGAAWQQYHKATLEDVPMIGVKATFSDASQSKGCAQSSFASCVRASRFQVEADFESATASGHARANKLGTDSAYLTFFDENNAEALVKVLDGCALNGHYWVFAGGLTNVGVTLRVTDTQTGKTKTYTNPKGTVFKAVQDVTAFSCTP